MGGEIGVRSALQAGSLFWFTLPLIRATAVRAGAPARDLTGTRVVVDDNDTNRRILERQLAAWGLIPDSAGDGQTALELMHRPMPSAGPLSRSSRG